MVHLTIARVEKEAEMSLETKQTASSGTTQATPTEVAQTSPRMVYIVFLLAMSVAGFLFGYFGAMLLHLGDQIANNPQTAKTVLATIPEFNNAMYGLIGAVVLAAVALLLLHSQRMRRINRDFYQ